MDLELAPETIDAVIFCMENQNEAFLFDTQSLRCVPANVPPSENLIPLPEWTAPHGFALMEEFSGSVKNPVLQEKLREAISTRSGVFRRFKETLASYPEFDRAWRAFKKARLSKTVREWFAAFAQAESLASIGDEPEETAEIVQSDFALLQKKPQGSLQLAMEALARGASAEDAFARLGVEGAAHEEILVQGAAEALKGLSEGAAGALAALFARVLAGGGQKTLFCAETALGEAVGILLVERLAARGKGADALLAAAVRPAFRGMGIFTQLLEMAALSAKEGGRDLLCAMPIPMRFLLPTLERSGAIVCLAPFSGY